MLIKNLPLCAFYSVEAVSVRPSNNIAGFLSPLNICNSIRQTLICNGQSNITSINTCFYLLWRLLWLLLARPKYFFTREITTVITLVKNPLVLLVFLTAKC